MNVNSYNQFQQFLKNGNSNWLLIYKEGSAASDCAKKNIEDAIKKVEDINIFYADVNTVRDIHPEYKINTVPSLLELSGRKLKNIIKGCNDSSYYESLFNDSLYLAQVKNTDVPARRVTVYSTPTCPWCTTLKNYLKQNKIRFTDIDVSRNQNAAEELVRKSGQKGVPQTEINGEIIVGFNKSKINELLQIQG
ncbi:MAG: glutaredoxin family protein [Bacteroidota bacterium]